MLAGVLAIVVLTSLDAAASPQGNSPPVTSPQEGVQRVTAPPSAKSRIHLLNARQGHEIVVTAQDHEPASRKTQDCSHLVQEIYHRAGFPYPYASSFDLYAGAAENFERVKNLQAGDLIVWPGHVGIVASPKDHLFYSLVRSGLEQSDFESPYWRARGRARFYRYIVGGRGTRLSSTREADDDDGADIAPKAARPNGKSAGARTKPSTKEASERTPVFGPAEESATEKVAAIPRSIVLGEGRKQPTSEAVAAGISELSSASGGVLRGDAAQAMVPVVVFDQFKVNKVELKRDRGWAFVELQMRASLWGGEADMAARTEMVRWELRKGKSGWEAVAPYDRTFVPRDVAVRNIAARISDLTAQDGGDKEALRREEARLTKLLGVLLSDDGEKQAVEHQ
jgi:hypothetical protein